MRSPTGRAYCNTLVISPTYTSGKRHPKEWELSPRLTTFTNHSETLTRESELSLTTLLKTLTQWVKTLTRYGENCHWSYIHKWKLPHIPVENVTPKSENFHPRPTIFTYHSEWDSHILQWKTTPQRVRTFTHVSPTTVRLSPANPNFHSPHWKLSPHSVVTLTQHCENSHLTRW